MVFGIESNNPDRGIQTYLRWYVCIHSIVEWIQADILTTKHYNTDLLLK